MVESLLVTTSFPGFDSELPDFLATLRSTIHGDLSTVEREQFRKLCLEPCLAFITAIRPILVAADPPHKAIAETGKSLRNFRDDAESNSSTHRSFLHLVFWSGSEALRSPTLHLVLSPGGMGIGAGQWAFDAGELANYQEALSDPSSVADLVRAIESAKLGGCHLERPTLRQPPDGLLLTGQARQLAHHSGLVVRNRNEAYHPDFFTPVCVDMVAQRLTYLLPLQKWILGHVHQVS